jgi:hypothetical protein
MLPGRHWIQEVRFEVAPLRSHSDPPQTFPRSASYVGEWRQAAACAGRRHSPSARIRSGFSRRYRTFRAAHWEQRRTDSGERHVARLSNRSPGRLGALVTFLCLAIVCLAIVCLASPAAVQFAAL